MMVAVCSAGRCSIQSQLPRIEPAFTTESGDADSAMGGAGSEMQQLVLYDDKAKLAFEAVEKKVKIKKGKKRKPQIKDHAAYRQGKASASKVNLGAKALPAC